MKSTQPPGHGYAIRKHPATWPPANSQEVCGTRSGKNPEKYCDILQQGTFSRKVIVDLSMTRRSSYRVCLHRPIKHHNLRSFNVLKTTPFISADPKDRALGLPGVSVSRLLDKEPNILLNANMSISSLSSIGVSHPSDTLTIPSPMNIGLLSHYTYGTPRGKIHNVHSRIFAVSPFWAHRGNCLFSSINFRSVLP